MAASPRCSRCDAPLPPDTGEALCPACLPQRGLDVTASSAEVQQAGVGGTTLRYFGDYEIQHEIARGGMGIVYKARQVTLNRPVALKMILAGTLADQAAIRRFHTEAEAAANLQHPNIVAIHEIGVHEGQHYFSMDYVEGRSLSAVIASGPMPAARAAGYVRTIAEAIYYAHQRGTLHRDLKPSNILIDTDDRPRITDFGLAKTGGGDTRLTITGTVMGTASYMSPEQALGRQAQIGPHSDVYSLGAILYELLTGSPPFRADSVHATLLGVIQDEPAAPRTVKTDVPADVETICLKCLEKSPQRRYATARELADDLGRFADRDPILARPASVSRKIEQWVKRRPLVLAGAAALLLLALAALSYELWQQNRYLAWQAAHPETRRVAGPRTEYFRRLDDIAPWLYVVAMAPLFMYRKRLGEPWAMPRVWLPRAGPMDQERAAPRPIRPFSLGLLQLLEVLGAVSVAFALFYLAKFIDAWVWEGYARVTAWIKVYSMLSMGCFVVQTTRRQRNIQLFGAPSRQ